LYGALAFAARNRSPHDVNTPPDKALIIWMPAEMRPAEVMDTTSARGKFAATISDKKYKDIKVFHAIDFVNEVEGRALAKGHAENFRFE
jgi:hypothetical protein